MAYKMQNNVSYAVEVVEMGLKNDKRGSGHMIA